jgi:hypothetical protein
MSVMCSFAFPLQLKYSSLFFFFFVLGLEISLMHEVMLLSNTSV